ncbi:MAG: DUF1569 domain-containing protein [Oleispira sp.]|nr:DUF1569 domain-containing protein [Oleispira sp.]MBL4881391.1 DUF1569 domain-containing protein [Oleispira sp.]
MERRQFVKASAVAGLGLLGGVSVWLNIGPDKESLTIAVVLRKLEALTDKPISHSGNWDPAKVFVHCAQSIEYSMTGYPEHKSDVFKNTVGSLAFSAFAVKGAMTHGLDQPIPGAPAINSDQNLPLALAQLKQSLVDFSQYKGELKPHFAYGELTKAEYEAAHVMHVYNHLQEFSV